MTTTLPAPAPLADTETAEYTLCYCTDDKHRGDDHESTWRADYDGVEYDALYYDPTSHVIRRATRVETVRAAEVTL